MNQSCEVKESPETRALRVTSHLPPSRASHRPGVRSPPAAVPERGPGRPEDTRLTKALAQGKTPPRPADHLGTCSRLGSRARACCQHSSYPSSGDAGARLTCPQTTAITALLPRPGALRSPAGFGPVLARLLYPPSLPPSALPKSKI